MNVVTDFSRMYRRRVLTGLFGVTIICLAGLMGVLLPFLSGKLFWIALLGIPIALSLNGFRVRRRVALSWDQSMMLVALIMANVLGAAFLLIRSF